jgi:hypothetical protein
MIDPSFPALDLRGDSELIVFFRQPPAIFFDDATDADTPKYGRCYCQAFDHFDLRI